MGVARVMISEPGHSTEDMERLLDLTGELIIQLG